MKRKTKLLIRDAFLSTILSCILLGILSLAFLNLRFFNPVHKVFKDFSFLDVYYSQKFDESAKINEEVVLVNIENNDRTGIVFLLENVLKGNPKVVGFDIILNETIQHDATDSLISRLLENPKVITSYNFQDGKPQRNDRFFDNGRSGGFVNFNFDDEFAVVRDFIGYELVDTVRHTAFATKISHTYLGDKKWKKYKYDKKLSKPQYIRYSGNIEKFPVLSYQDLLFDDHKEFLKGRIVIIGYAGMANSDNRFDIEDKKWTPLNEYIAGKSDRDMYGMVVHANIVNMLIKNNLITRVSNFWLGVITFICMFFSTMVYMKLNRYYKISYRTRKQTYQFIFSVVLLAVVFWLLHLDIVLRPLIIIIGVLLAGSYFKYYKHLVRYIKSKRKWKTYVK